MKRQKFNSVRLLCMLFFCICAFRTSVSAETYSGTCGANASWTLTDTGTLTISGSGPINDFDRETPSWTIVTSLEQKKSISVPVKKVIIKSGITRIGNKTFFPNMSQHELAQVTIPDSVTSIGEYAFASCSELTSIQMNGVTSIGEYAFARCTALKDMQMKKIESIGERAFDSCTNLYAISSLNGVKSFGDYAFAECNCLANVEIGSGAVMGQGVFYQCRGLTKAVIAAETVGLNDFSGATHLKSLTFKKGVKKIDTNAFNLCSSLTSFTLPDSVTTIESSAFNWCYRLQTVKGGANVTSIGDFAFANCLKLTTFGDKNGVVTLKKVNKIGQDAFSTCMIGKLDLASTSLKEIGSNAFRYCHRLASVTVRSQKLKTVGYAAFWDIKFNCDFKVPAKKKAAYKKLLPIR